MLRLSDVIVYTVCFLWLEIVPEVPVKDHTYFAQAVLFICWMGMVTKFSSMCVTHMC